MLQFYKYQGTGNDFIIADNRGKNIKLNRKTIEQLCNRRFGVGADGLMLLQNKKRYDFEMIYFNSDGRESSMCGNGGRCITAFAGKLGIIKESATFYAIDGPHEAKIISSSGNKDVVSLKMCNVNSTEKNPGFIFLNTGSPHYVVFVEDVKGIDVFNEGRKIRYSERFKEKGTNVNFVEPAENVIKVRTYERGVEDETLSCGTGVTAAALAVALKQKSNIDLYNIETPGGKLRVFFKKNGATFTDIWLEGEAEFVFKGEIKQLPSPGGAGGGL